MATLPTYGYLSRQIVHWLFIAAICLGGSPEVIAAEPVAKPPSKNGSGTQRKPAGKPKPKPKRKPKKQPTISEVSGARMDAGPVTFETFSIGFNSPTDAALQRTLEAFDSELRGKYQMDPKQTSVGLLDIKTLRLAMVNPDRGEYVASLAQLGILLAYFQMHPQGGTNLAPKTLEQLGKMIKGSDSELASLFSLEIGLLDIQKVLNSYGFYDPNRGGGLWMGKHFAVSSERYGDPVDDHSHAATVRQVLRYYLLMEQGKLVSPESSRIMRSVFLAPDVAAPNNKFVKALAGRDIQMVRKMGVFKQYHSDSAVITGKNRHYILVGLTSHANGEKYLSDLALRVDDLLAAGTP